MNGHGRRRFYWPGELRANRANTASERGQHRKSSRRKAPQLSTPPSLRYPSLFVFTLPTRWYVLWTILKKKKQLTHEQSNPTQIFAEDVTEEKGENARLSAFVGAIAVGDLVKSTLGPKGMDKILQSAYVHATPLWIWNRTHFSSQLYR